MLYITVIVALVLVAALLAKAMDQHHMRKWVVPTIDSMGDDEVEEEVGSGHSLAEHLAIAGDKATGVLEVVAGQHKHMRAQGFNEELADQMSFALYAAMLGS